MKRENYNKRNGVIKLIIQESEETFEFGDFVEGVINFKRTKSDKSDVLGKEIKGIRGFGAKSKESKVLGQFRE